MWLFLNLLETDFFHLYIADVGYDRVEKNCPLVQLHSFTDVISCVWRNMFNCSFTSVVLVEKHCLGSFTAIVIISLNGNGKIY